MFHVYHARDYPDWLSNGKTGYKLYNFHFPLYLEKTIIILDS